MRKSFSSIANVFKVQHIDSPITFSFAIITVIVIDTDSSRHIAEV